MTAIATGPDSSSETHTDTVPSVAPSISQSVATSSLGGKDGASRAAYSSCSSVGSVTRRMVGSMLTSASWGEASVRKQVLSPARAS